ncbi:hypothetical protein TWF281_002464 [Arthrobotrys megalospora]
MIWNEVYAVYFLVLGAGRCTVICDACRPIDKVNSPGIGIDLTMGYGVAVLHYGNGTVVDVAKIDGNRAYVNAMKDLADDALRIQPRLDRNWFIDLPGFGYAGSYDPPEPSIRGASWIEKLRAISIPTIKLLKDWAGIKDSVTNIERPRSYIDTKRLLKREKLWVEAVSPVIAELRARIDAVHTLERPAIGLSIPDFCFHLPKCRSYFRTAASDAAMDTFGYAMTASRAAIYGHAAELMDFPIFDDVDDETFDKMVDEALIVDYSGVAITATLLQRDYRIGNLYPVEFYMEPKLGANKFKESGRNNRYQDYQRGLQDWIHTCFNQTIRNRVGYLLLTGDASTNIVLHEVLKRALKRIHILRRKAIGDPPKTPFSALAELWRHLGGYG